MRKSLIIFLFFNALIYSQTKFSQGFKDGYEKGYCQDRGMSCIPPIPPISPIPQVGENLDSYQDGYNRGFKMGMSAQSGKENNSRRTFKTAGTQFVDDFIYNPYKNTNLIELKVNAVKSLFENAIKSQENGDYDLSIEYTKRILKIVPDLSGAYGIMSVSYYRKGELINAYNTAFKAYNLDNSNKDWYDRVFYETQNLLVDLMKKGYYVDVQNICENVWYKNNLTNYFLGLSLYYQNDLKGAKKSFKKVTNYEPAKTYLTAIENKQTIPNPYFEIKEYSPEKNSSDISEYVKKINNYFSNKWYENAISDINKNIDNYPKDVLYGLRGYAYYNIGNFKNAIDDITMSLNNSKAPNPDLIFTRALAKESIGQTEETLYDYELLIRVGEKNKGRTYDMATVYNNKAYAFVKLKRYSEALPLVNKALELNDKHWYIWDTKGEIDFYSEDYNNCIESMTRAIELHKDKNSYLLRGQSFLKIGKKDKACKDFNDALNLGEQKASELKSLHCN